MERDQRVGTASKTDPIQAVLLAALRVALLRTKLLEADIEAIGVSLRCALISPQQAFDAMCDLGIGDTLDQLVGIDKIQTTLSSDAPPNAR